jgi:hypothetical protein
VRAQLAAARDALGGRARLASISGLILRGTTITQATRSRTGTVPATLEIRVRFPDSCLRIATSTGITRASGFVGNHVLQKWTSSNPAAQMNPPIDTEAIAVVQTRWARLLLGLLADTRLIGPLRLRGGASAGDVYTVEFAGADETTTRLDLDARSHLPLRIRYQASARFPRPRAAAPGAARDEPNAGPPPLEPTELIWTFDERQVIQGVNVPRRIIESARGVTFEETHLDEVRLNPSFGPKDFEP